MAENTCGCSCDSTNCCSTANGSKKINIDFLYLDLNVCKRCQGTDSTLDEAVNDVSTILSLAGYVITVNKVNITSKELAEQYEFISSPTIRINGNDIVLETKENSCKECGDLCGDDVDCRVWTYEGKDYNEPPKALIINAILNEVYGAKANHEIRNKAYMLPENLANFFNKINSNNL